MRRLLFGLGVLFLLVGHSGKIHAITIDGDLSDWPDTTAVFARGVTDFRMYWDNTYFYGAVNRGAAFKNLSASDYDVVMFYFAVPGAGAGRTDAADWNSDYTLPTAFHKVFMVRPVELDDATPPYFDLRDWNNANVSWWDGGPDNTTTEADTWVNAASGVLEFRIPWAQITGAGIPASLKVAMYVQNGSNGYLWAVSPPATFIGPTPQTIADYFEFPDMASPLAGAINDEIYTRNDTPILQGGSSPSPAFTPVLDGLKDNRWGNTPLATSTQGGDPNSNDVGTDGTTFPEGLAKDIYVTNDAAFLYIGWEAMGDHYQYDVNQLLQVAEYGFLVYADTYPGFSYYDPWKDSSKTTPFSTWSYWYAPDVWVNGWTDFGNNSFPSMSKYTPDATGDWTSSPVTLTEGVDQKVSISNGWGELRIPLSDLGNLKVGDAVGVIHTARHEAPKQGINDVTPYYSYGAGWPWSNWADTDAMIDPTQAAVYLIQEALVNAFHRPADEPVTGKGIMRNPLEPSAANPPSLLAGVTPSAASPTLTLVYSTDNWVSSGTTPFSVSFTSGDEKYYEVQVPPGAIKGQTVKYYIEISSITTNYLYGSDTISTVDTVQANALAGAFSYVVQNETPTQPSVTLSPLSPSNSDTITATASGSTDMDGDSLTYTFYWYRDGALVPQLTESDQTSPYTSSIGGDTTQPGELWHVEVVVTDGEDTTIPVSSASILYSDMVEWSGKSPPGSNQGLVTDSEWIFLDRTGDQRTIPPNSGNFDIVESRLKLDTMYLYIRTIFQDLTNDYYPNLAVAFSRTTSGSNDFVGDESNLTLGKEYAGFGPRFDTLLVLHAIDQSQPGIELSDGVNWVDGNGNDILIIDTGSNTIEARVLRSEVGLTGSDSVMVSLAVFKNRLGRAATINSTVEYPVTDALDNVGVVMYGVDDAVNSIDAYNGELWDGELDFWGWFAYDGNGILDNDSPGSPINPTPADGDTTDQVRPTFDWDFPPDPTANDTIVSFLLEIGRNSDLDGNVEQRYNLAADSRPFTLPSDLTSGETYYWRVRSRDKAGQLSVGSVWSVAVVAPQIFAATPEDENNFNNLGQFQGDETRDSDIRWDWAPALHSLGSVVKDYVIQISTDPSFGYVVIEDTILGSNTAGTTTYVVDPADRGLLVRDNVYYARIKGGDTDIPQNWGDWSGVSDGVYYSLKMIDGGFDDWDQSGGWTLNTVNLSSSPFYEAIWKDTSLDQRTDVLPQANNLDLDEVHIAADRYNLYFLVTFTAWDDGTPMVQLALDVNGNSANRFFQGNGTFAEDSFTSGDVPWEYIVLGITGDDLVQIKNNDWNLMGKGRYTENATGKGIEIAVPYSKLGGAGNILGKTINLTTAVFWNSGGGTPGTFGSNNSNVVDAVTDAAQTWTEVSDGVIDKYLAITIDNTGHITAVSLESPTGTTPPPTNPTPGESFYGGMRDYIIYNVFVDRWWSGRSDNQPNGWTPTDQVSAAGDFQGIIDYIKDGYFNWLGMNGIKLSPIQDFGSNTGWGYWPNDQFAVNWSFTNPNTYGQFKGWDEYVRLTKIAGYHNIKIGPDFVQGHAGGLGSTLAQRHPDMYLDKNGNGVSLFGSGVWWWTANSRQFYSDYTRFLYSLGSSFFRIDNAKFTDSGNPDAERGQPFWAYWRNKKDEFAPDLYAFGEAPDAASVVASLCSAPERIPGMLDGDMTGGNVKGWARAWNSSDDFKNAWEGMYSSFNSSGNPVMINYYENHDHNRAYSSMGGSHGWPGATSGMQMVMLWEATGVGNPYIFYGDERVISGERGYRWPDAAPAVDANGNEDQRVMGVTRRFPWDHESGIVGQIKDYSGQSYPGDDPGPGTVGDIVGAVSQMFHARQIFPALRYDQSGLYWDHTDGFAPMTFIRGRATGEEVVVMFNPTSSAVTLTAPNATGGSYEDWLSPGSVFSGADVTTNGVSVPSFYGRILKINEFGLASLTITTEVNGTPVNGAIVSVDDKACWTRETKNSGATETINDIVTSPGGSTNYTVKIWYPPYEYSATWTFNDGANIVSTIDLATDTNSTLDNVAPAVPVGLVAVPRHRGVELDWSDIPNEDAKHISYYVYRSKTPNDPNPTMIIETVRSLYFDNDFDQGLTDGETYYYKVKALDRNGNVSGFSNEVSAVPNKKRVIFQVDASQSIGGLDASNIKQVYIQGNSTALGRFDYNQFSYIQWVNLGMNDGLLAMTNKGRGIWEVEVGMDPGMNVNYIFTAELNDGSFFDDYNAAGSTSHWNSYAFENARGVTVEGLSTSAPQPVVRQFNVVGDQAPQKPVGLTAVPGNNNVKLGWSLNLEADMDHYFVQRADDAGFTVNVQNFDVDKSVFNYTDYSVSNGNLYYYRIYAEDLGGNISSPSDPISVTPTSAIDTVPPNFPQNLSASEAGQGMITLSWDFNTEGDLAGYNVYRSTVSTFQLDNTTKRNTSLVSATTSPSFTDQGLSTGQQYYYVVTAVDDFLNESDSSTALGVKLARLTFTVDVGEVSPSDVVLTSKNNSFVGISPGKTMTKVSGSVSTYTYTSDFVVGSQLQLKYAYNSLAVLEEDFSTGSRYREITVPNVSSRTYIHDWEELPDQVTGAGATADSGAAFIYWDPVSNVEDLEGYNIYEQTDTSFVKVNSSPISGTGYRIGGLTNGTTYLYTVRAQDSGDIEFESVNSSTISVTPQGTVFVIFRN